MAHVVMVGHAMRCQICEGTRVSRSWASTVEEDEGRVGVAALDVLLALEIPEVLVVVPLLLVELAAQVRQVAGEQPAADPDASVTSVACCKMMLP